MADAAEIDIEVAYAEPDRQFLRRIALPFGATVADAILASGLEAEFAIDVSSLAAGIWSKPVARDAPLSNGDRVEIYRPLTVDPKEARRRRAKRTRQP
ncbi:MAG TPA: RnfH family protein [Rhodanobacteraceae bacterium]|jgi:putative ubiquitin-RnfH superfamily antitoxin RatB of RatAB toxin-antitoxin module|nr:RnfH family protein [Rhodanobacteraceae bacterium]